jgi:hypothetical protein
LPETIAMRTETLNPQPAVGRKAVHHTATDPSPVELLLHRRRFRHVRQRV